jgi:hypothetical protein
LLAGALNATLLSVPYTVVEPVQGHFNLDEGQGIFAAFEVAGLETLQPVAADLQQVFNEDAVDAVFLYGTFLEMDVGVMLIRRSIGEVLVGDNVLMKRAARSGLVHDENTGKAVLALVELEHVTSLLFPVLRGGC